MLRVQMHESNSQREERTNVNTFFLNVAKFEVLAILPVENLSFTCWASKIKS